jgi:Neuraminidase (sialidase)
MTKTLSELPHGWFFYCLDCDVYIAAGEKLGTGQFQSRGRKHAEENVGHRVWMVFNDRLWSSHPDIMAAIVRS